jgi:phosphoribosyl-ATP pyrophosphohydrolase
MATRKKGAAAARNRQLDEAAERLKRDALAFALAGVHGRHNQIIDTSGDLLATITLILERRNVNLDDVKESYLRRRHERESLSKTRA